MTPRKRSSDRETAEHAVGNAVLEADLRYIAGPTSKDSAKGGHELPRDNADVEKDRRPKERIPVDKDWFQDQIRNARALRGVSTDGRAINVGSQRQLAFKMGLDPAAMTQMLNGFRKMSIAEAGEIAQWLEQPIDEVIRRAGGYAHMAGHMRTPAQIAAMGGAKAPVGPDSGAVLQHLDRAVGTVDVVGWVDAAGVVTMGRAAGPAAVDRPPGVPAGAVALRLQSRDMWDGWLVFYKPGVGIGPEAVGQMCVVERADGVKQLRFVQHGYGPGLWCVGGGLWPREDDVALVSAAPVLWMKQR